MMPLIICLFFLHMLTTIKISESKMNVFKHDFHHKVRNTVLTMIIFKEKKLHKLCNTVKNTLQTYNNKTIVTVAETYFRYNDLSEEDKIIIETIIALCY